VTSQGALLVMDYQVGVVARHVKDPGQVRRVAGAIRAARDANLTIVFVRVAFRTGYPEIDPANKIFSSVASSRLLSEGDESSAIVPELGREASDITVTKRRVSAFAGSDLEVILRGRGVRSLTLAGIATGGVVLSTLTQAADLDLSLTVLSDGCSDADPQVHSVLLEKVFPRQATVTSIDRWMPDLATRPKGGRP
jgi:nicotinamidase-related amidase